MPTTYMKACGYDAMGRAKVASKTSLPEYIATQAPLTHTEADFHYMVHQQRSPVVLMLCNTFEGGSNKCGQYWPDAEGFPVVKRSLTRTVTVTLQQTIPSDFMVTRMLTVQPEGESKLIFSTAYDTRCVFVWPFCMLRVVAGVVFSVDIDAAPFSGLG
ncbi:unnamed protein product [Dibothriocephalus latus]|uniref:Tyrosine-protein phosphatase domain-containing protein n=1 Tax=Dibothriocephalus latus TaxID=60516 RepID=A0A3P7NMM5_DIBLA|nr:unnamed protein product [Dibothriocephalus latus]